jgi:zinc transporter ZupT
MSALISILCAIVGIAAGIYSQPFIERREWLPAGLIFAGGFFVVLCITITGELLK